MDELGVGHPVQLAIDDFLGKRGLMAAYQSAYKMWDRSRRHSEDRQVSIKE
jgi:hypothetical protein